MAKAIEQTPELEGKDATRFLEIISKVDRAILEKHEKEVKELVKKLPEHLRLK
ncbi:hypothetical protein HZB03_04605 [Candidatus Woesearchaeota archaeon]|nr:hypothetical protein [Candidatus Woesearchaeota archaeon]